MGLLQRIDADFVEPRFVKNCIFKELKTHTDVKHTLKKSEETKHAPFVN